jgi:hypothetical protein
MQRNIDGERVEVNNAEEYNIDEERDGKQCGGI